ncbi:helix-turn-helix domain-containing protein [Acrocarpospora catenulata]|uniref:helix-turn-helix domain-containing protein n=1 Tax=Acrocarpospora catenulata TaxID=2836182 RepID=UPI001BDB2205|nr:hypothetical protein [Acrocarpospora catenulata]
MICFQPASVIGEFPGAVAIGVNSGDDGDVLALRPWERGLKPAKMGVAAAEICSDADLADRYRSGKSVRKIAQDVGLSWRKVRAALDREGVVMRRQSSVPWLMVKVDVDELIRRYESGATLSELAKENGRDPSVVRNRLHDAGVTLRVPLKPLAGRLSESELRERHAAGQSLGSLAKLAGMSKSALRKRLPGLPIPPAGAGVPDAR